MAERKGRGHLYSEESKEDFERRYGKEHGDLVWGETIGKTAREQARKDGGVKIEHVEGHISHTPEGKRFRVKGHKASIRAHPHPHGHHKGPCSVDCRAGRTPHGGHRR